MPPEDKNRTFRPDDPFAFTITLFGKANNYLPHVVYAVQEMGRTGLGKKAAEGRFQVTAVQINNETIYQEDGSLNIPRTLLNIDILTTPPEAASNLAVTFRTPLRLKHQNRLQQELPFHLLIRTALRRIATLEQAYGAGEPDLDYKNLVADAGKVRMVTADCRWLDIPRYSNRQKTSMLLGGIQGKIKYQGDDLTDFLPLLRYCEITHLGKQTSFGLGRISVQEPAVS